jgi:hypothetical protein
VRSSIFAIIFTGLLVSPQALGMQPIVREQKSVQKTLQDNFVQFKKRIKCSGGAEGCTPKERDARKYFGELVRILLVIGVGITITGNLIYIRWQTAQKIQRIREQLKKEVLLNEKKISGFSAELARITHP